MYLGCSVLAEQLEANVSSLQSLLAELSDEERTILTDITLAETTNSDTQTAIEEVRIRIMSQFDIRAGNLISAFLCWALLISSKFRPNELPHILFKV